jgi:3-hydroxybutyryl-CoA dehydrogenase
MAAEAFRCLEEGVASPEDIDRIVKTSFGFRLGAYGVFEIADLAGLDTYQGVYDYLFDRYRDPRYEAPKMLRDLVQQGRVGVKAGGGVYTYSDDEARKLRAERDRKLYARLRAYRAERDSTRAAGSAAAPAPAAGV